MTFYYVLLLYAAAVTRSFVLRERNNRVFGRELRERTGVRVLSQKDVGPVLNATDCKIHNGLSEQYIDISEILRRHGYHYYYYLQRIIDIKRDFSNFLEFVATDTRHVCSHALIVFFLI